MYTRIRKRDRLLVTGLSFLVCGGGQTPARRMAPAQLNALRNILCSPRSAVSRRSFVSSHVSSMCDGTSARRLLGGSRKQFQATMVDRAAHATKIKELRDAMEAAGVYAFVVPSGDPHLSEYVHPAYKRLAFISGFTGSAGVALVTLDSAYLWTDGRYFLQAENELSDEWTLMRMGEPGVLDLEKWVAENLPSNSKLGIDPFIHSGKDARSLSEALSKANRNLELFPLSNSSNLVDIVWGAQRPNLPKALARVLPLDISGQPVTEKLEVVGKSMAEKSASAFLVTSLDEVCWLLNLRGADVPHCPVLQAYVLVHRNEVTLSSGNTSTLLSATLFVDESKIPKHIEAELKLFGVELAPYDEIETAVRAVGKNGGTLMLDPESVNYGLQLAAGAGNSVLATSPIKLPKAIKNQAEIDGMAAAHLVDGAAVANFFAWLNRTVVHEETALTEVDIVKKLAEFRSAQPGFIEVSFDTIAGVGPNGAIIHYNPCVAAPESVRSFDGSEMMLLDSGGQYATGTTDVTRTIHLGEPTEWQRQCFTRVLKGNIALDTMVFPEDTPGMALDAFARRELWSVGLDYKHGTGHGVGAALNVHEGPMSISQKQWITQGLKEGMIVSNEPGYYEQGHFGIRIENLLVIKEKTMPGAIDGKKFLCFEQLTHIPIQSSLIDISLLSPTEIKWVDNYHSRVWERVSPHLQHEGSGYNWLRQATRPLLEQI